MVSADFTESVTVINIFYKLLFALDMTISLGTAVLYLRRERFSRNSDVNRDKNMGNHSCKHIAPNDYIYRRGAT
jgi:hypothetical protein